MSVSDGPVSAETGGSVMDHHSLPPVSAETGVSE